VIFLSEILFTVEGVTDRGAVKGVAHKYRKKIIVDLMDGNRACKIKGLIKTRKCEKYVLIKDLHTYEEQSIRKIYNNVKNNINAHLKDLVDLIIIKYEIETWFLSDIDAINKVFNCDIRIKINNTEDITDPSTYLDEILITHGKRYIKNEKLAYNIMQEANYEILSNKCSSFKAFLKYFI